MKNNSKHEFKFVLTGVELTDEQQEQISRAVAQAGALALGGLAPRGSLSVRLGKNIWWQGQPADELIQEIQRHAAAEAGLG